LERVEAARAKAIGRPILEALPVEVQTVQARGPAAEAAQLSENYVALARERYGADQPGLVATLLEAAFLSQQQKTYAKAESLLKQALRFVELLSVPVAPKWSIQPRRAQMT